MNGSGNVPAVLATLSRMDFGQVIYVVRQIYDVTLAYLI